MVAKTEKFPSASLWGDLHNKDVSQVQTGTEVYPHTFIQVNVVRRFTSLKREVISFFANCGCKPTLIHQTLIHKSITMLQNRKAEGDFQYVTIFLMNLALPLILIQSSNTVRFIVGKICWWKVGQQQLLFHIQSHNVQSVLFNCSRLSVVLEKIEDSSVFR